MTRFYQRAMSKLLLISFILCSSVIAVNAATVATVSGTGTAGFANGSIATARLNNPRGVALDSSGNIYVADVSNNRIRRIDTDGNVTTFAGSGTAGFIDGAPGTARFNQPHDVAVDTAGNVYVADRNNRRIRKILPNGTVSTLSGTGAAGFTDGAGGVARFNNPEGVAVNAAGEVFVADLSNQRIRKILPDGTTSTLAGDGVAGFVDGTGAGARFSSPVAVAIDPTNGDVIVGDNVNDAIRRVTQAGVVTTVAGSNIPAFADGPGTSALFNAPEGVAVDSNGNIYVADRANNRIRFINTSNVVGTIAGTGAQGFSDGTDALSAIFANPQGIAIDSSGNVVVGDILNHRIRRITEVTDPITPPGPPTPPAPDNNAPLIQFINQPNQNVFNPGESLVLEAIALDVEDGNIDSSITWTSSLDGVVATGAEFNIENLSSGLHTITATATDSGAATASASQTIIILEAVPTAVEIVSPTRSRKRRRRTRLRGVAFEIISGQSINVSDEIQWSSNIQGILGTGESIRVRLVRGTHIITARVNDSTDTHEITIGRRRR